MIRSLFKRRPCSAILTIAFSLLCLTGCTSRDSGTRVRIIEYICSERFPTDVEALSSVDNTRDFVITYSGSKYLAARRVSLFIETAADESVLREDIIGILKPKFAEDINYTSIQKASEPTTFSLIETHKSRPVSINGLISPRERFSMPKQGYRLVIFVQG